MTKLGILVGEDNWTFFREIFKDLQIHYQTQVYQKKVYRTRLFQQRLNHWRCRQDLRTMLRNNDICFFEWASDLLAPASHMPKRCRIITRLHSFELHQWAPRICWENVDKVILVSEAMQAMFVELYPEQQQKTVVIYNGKALDDYQVPAQKPFQFHLGMLCNISPIKRIYEVILLVYTLRQQGYAARLYIAGKPLDLRYAAAIDRLVKTLALQDTVIFDGYVTDTPAWLQKIDIFISNSFWEGQQVALLEAMASGCYCLAHRWAGAEEMLPPGNLYLTDAELQQKIIAYSEKPAAEQSHCQAKLIAVAHERFDLDRTKDQVRSMIAALV